MARATKADLVSFTNNVENKLAQQRNVVNELFNKRKADVEQFFHDKMKRFEDFVAAEKAKEAEAADQTAAG